MRVPWPFVISGFHGTVTFNALTVVFQVGNPKLILQKFPSLGKFLGQLFENDVILLSGEI